MSSARKKAIKKADTYFSKYIRLRDGNESVMSGPSDKVMNCGHVLTRSYFNTRWDERNAFSTTAGENWNHEQNPKVFDNWVIGAFGMDYYSALVVIAHADGPRWTNEAISEVANHWKRKYKELEEHVRHEDHDRNWQIGYHNPEIVKGIYEGQGIPPSFDHA